MRVAGRAELDSSFECLIEPALAGLVLELAGIGSLGDSERTALVGGARRALAATVRRKLARTLLLELHAARLSGSLSAPDSESRWDEFLQRAADPRFWQGLSQHYPTLLRRLDVLVRRRCEAAAELGRRFDADRSALAALLPGRADGPAELRTVRFGEGDSHRGGRTVSVLELGTGSVVYKPRSLAADRALVDLLRAVHAGAGLPERIRVPCVLERVGYGWSEFVAHRYCSSEAELTDYYTGLGHWLAIARLLSVTDLHAENLIACGPTPTLIDCETLFSPLPSQPPSGYGDAVDRAGALLGGSVFRSGLLPGRGAALGWRGVDISAAAALPGQQPLGEVPVLLDTGTDRARIGTAARQPIPTGNQPSERAQLHRFWPQVLVGFDELAERLRQLDRDGRLEPLLAGFAEVEVRAVLRATEAYAELGRMLWHPAALHDEPAAVARATDLLLRQAAVAGSPSDPAVVGAEIAELLEGDVPYFTTRPAVGQLSGPRGTIVGSHLDLTADALHRWRSADLALERQVIRSSLASAYLDEDWKGRTARLSVPVGGTGARAGHRQQLAAGLVERIVRTAIRGDDGTATWVAPSMTSIGWSLRAVAGDLYSGGLGIAVLLAAYRHEVAAGRALAVAGVDDVLEAVLATCRAAEAVRQRNRAGEAAVRPEPPGLYVGLSSQIWCWLTLREFGVATDDPLARAAALAALLPESLAASPEHDLLIGTAGAIVALLRLAAASGEARWLELASSVGSQLVRTAVGHPDGGLRWRSPRSPDGIGGYAHGATGIGWALARLAEATGDAEARATAEAAFMFEETLYDTGPSGWLDARKPDEATVATAWCHGATGIGLASVDLLRQGIATGSVDHADVVRRAAASCWQDGLNWNHTLCHGDAGAWELLREATVLGLAPAGMALGEVQANFLASLTEHGPVVGIARNEFTPGLLPGIGGIAYQLLRMTPGCDLPSILVLG